MSTTRRLTSEEDSLAMDWTEQTTLSSVTLQSWAATTLRLDFIMQCVLSELYGVRRSLFCNLLRVSSRFSFGGTMIMNEIKENTFFFLHESFQPGPKDE